MKFVNFLLKTAKYIFLVFVIAISIFPPLWTLTSSFKNNDEIFNSTFSLPYTLQFDNYIMAFKQSPLGQYYINSLIVSAMSIVFGVFIFSLSAYIFARVNFKFKNLLFSILTLSMLIPVTATIFPIYIFINKIGLYNTKIGLVLVYSSLALPVALYIMRSFFLTIPKEMETAAYIDGAGFVRTFFQIILPLSKPGVASSAVLVFLGAWNDFLYALVLTSGNNARTVPLALTQFLSMYGNDYGQLFAASIVIILPSILIYVLLQKKIETALINGAIKG